jgi:outer membrane receptor protein involved in Fe transport
MRVISCHRHLRLFSTTAVNSFLGTTAARAVAQNDSVKAERSNYFDIGVSQIIIPGLTVGVDGYYKIVKNPIDEGQFGAPIILTAFNYANAYVCGAQVTVGYDRGPWSIYGNLAYGWAMGKNIVSAQFNSAQRWLRSLSYPRWQRRRRGRRNFRPATDRLGEPDTALLAPAVPDRTCAGGRSRDPL